MSAAEQQAAYMRMIERIGVAARELDACEPTMARLVEQLRQTREWGFVVDPTLARDVIQDPHGHIATQEKLAQAVVAFVAVWRELQAAALGEIARRAEAAGAILEDDSSPLEHRVEALAAQMFGRGFNAPRVSESCRDWYRAEARKVLGAKADG